MKIAIISGGRSDRNALQMVEKRLREAGHRTDPMNIDPP